MSDLSPETLLEIIAAFGAIATVILGLGVKRALAFAEKNYAIKVSAETRTKIDRAIETAVAFAEEQARKRFVQKVDLVPLPGEAKKEIAVQKARASAPAELSALSDAELEDLVDAKVNRLRPVLSLAPASAPPPSGAPLSIPVEHSSSLVPAASPVEFPKPPRLPGGR